MGSRPVCLTELHYIVVFRVHSSYWVSFFLVFSFFRERLLCIVMNTLQLCMSSPCGVGQKFGSHFTGIFSASWCCHTHLFTLKLDMPNSRYMGLLYIFGWLLKQIFFFQYVKKMDFMGVGESVLSGIRS